MRAHILYDDLLKAQSSLVLIDCLHLMYLVTPYDISEQVKPTLSHYYTIVSEHFLLKLINLFYLDFSLLN